jgi:hypothetical protein
MKLFATSFSLILSLAFATGDVAKTGAAQPGGKASVRRSSGASNEVRLVAERRFIQEEQAPEQATPRRPALQLYQPECPPLEEREEYIVPLANIRADLRLPKEIAQPIDCSSPLFKQLPGVIRDEQGRFLWARSDFWFAASDFHHYPLYWDNQPLERYGQSQAPIIEPFLSGAHFFATFAIIPYKMGIDRPCDDIYTLGFYRAGSPTPCIRQTLPWEWDAAAFQALAVVGFIFILP